MLGLKRPTRLAALVAVCTLGFGLHACSKQEVVERVGGSGTVKAPVISMPTQILGLRVTPEDVSKQIKSVQRRYVDSVGLFGLREGELLRGTLQVSRFNRLAENDREDFRRSVIGLVGGSSPLVISVEGKQVYFTTASDQKTFVWFDGQGLFLLSVHQDFEFPLTLLRRVIDLEIEL